MTVPRSERPIRLAAPDPGEEELSAIAEVFASGMLTNGPAVERFEREFAEAHDASEAVAFANGTVALAAMYLAAGIGPGDEVIVPSMTFVSTATSVLHVGATPVFADIDPATLNLDPDDVRRRVTRATRAVVPVHYAGQPADMGAFVALGEELGIPVLEDAAEAHGARFGGRPVGAHGLAGMFSFTPTKNMTTGEGGMVVTGDGAFAEQLRLLRNHGLGPEGLPVILGYNWRLSDILAAVGRVQLAKLPAKLERKRSLAARLTRRLEEIPGVSPPTVAPGCEHVYMLYTVLVEEGRDDLLAHLHRCGVEARVYFPRADRQPMFSHLPPADLPVTARVADQVLSLPIHAALEPADIDDMAEAIAAWAAPREPGTR